MAVVSYKQSVRGVHGGKVHSAEVAGHEDYHQARRKR